MASKRKIADVKELAFEAIVQQKNPFFLLDKDGESILFANKKFFEWLEHLSLKKIRKSRVIGSNIADVLKVFGHSEKEMCLFNHRFSEYGELELERAVYGKTVGKGIRFLRIGSANKKIGNKNVATQGMLILDERNQWLKKIGCLLGRVSEYKDVTTGEHVKRVQKRSVEMGIRIGLSRDELFLLELGAPLHDLGKVGIPDGILKKPSKLTDAEWMLMREHSIIGSTLLKETDDYLLKKIAVIPEQHHENFDGSGYPMGLSGKNIHIFARIVTLIDTFDALNNERPYKKAWTKEDIYKEIIRLTGVKFDRDLVPILWDILREEDLEWAEFLRKK
ncbi:MAG: HD domain-containing protein [Parcubacteria group bacterium]|nr:HD domain-containing protein [Parcubacteria group bacterium]